jgi:hypothetical protein
VEISFRKTVTMESRNTHIIYKHISYIHTHTHILPLFWKAMTTIMASFNSSSSRRLANGTPDDSQYNALVALYHATQMSSSTNWLDSTDYCNFAGITCHANGHDVQELDLTSSNLQGTVPTELGSLTRLYRLAVGSNQLHGALPSTLVNLVELEHFEVYRNDLTGPLPEWKNFTRLKRILVHKNRLTGTLSSDLCLLDNLHSLDLFQNDFHASIPDCLSNLSTLQIQDTGLTGIIPHGLCSGSFGCDGVACSSGKYHHPYGRQTDLASPCLSCPSSMFLGAISCPTPSPTTSAAPTLAFSGAPSQTPSTLLLGPSNPPSTRPSIQPSVESPTEASIMPTRGASSNDSPSKAPSVSIPSIAPSGVANSYTPTLPSRTNAPSITVLRSSISSTPSTPDVTESSFPPSNTHTSPPYALPGLTPTTPSFKEDPSSSRDASSSSLQDTNWALLVIALLLSVMAISAVIWVRRRGRQWWYDKRVSTPPSPFATIQEGTDEDDHVSLESDSGWNDTESSIGWQEEEREEIDQDEHSWNIYFPSLANTISSLPSVAEEKEDEEEG